MRAEGAPTVDEEQDKRQEWDQDQDQGPGRDDDEARRGAWHAPSWRGRHEPSAADGHAPAAADEALYHTAESYAARGWAVVPLRPGSKAPAVARWTELRLDAAGIARSFGGRANLGVLTGAASGGLVDVDCDTDEAALAAAVLLPPTPLVSGRASHPRSHYWYLVEGELPRTTKYAWDGIVSGGEADATPAKADTHRGMLVELRGDGCQTMLPPSLHPSGERVVWECGAPPAHDTCSEPARASGDVLRRAVGQVAAAALLARHWPGRGTRDETALALCGMLLRAGWADAETDLFVRTVARIGGDEEWRERGHKAKGTRQRLEAGETVWGAPALAQRLASGGDTGAAVVAQARAWLGIGAGSENSAIECQALIDCHLRSVAVNDEFGSQWGLLASEVDDAQVEWLWQDRIPLGMLTLLDGDPGLGKSLITADLIARVTSGREMPDGSPGIGTVGAHGMRPPGADGVRPGAGAVLLSSEDSQRATIRPRLRAAGADLARVLFEQTVRVWDEARDRVVERAFMLPTDLPLLREAIERVGAKLVVIDPLMAYLEGRVNSWRDQDIRAALAPLARLAEETGAAILILRHLNKSNGTNALYRGGGSIGIIGAARSGLLVAKSPDDPEHERVLTGTKSNLAAPASSLAYRIAQTDEGLPRIAWLGTSEYTASSLLSAPAGEMEPSSLEQAVAYVRDALTAGPMPSDTLQRQVLAAGISYRTYLRARKQLRVTTEHQGFGGRQWSRMPDAAEDAPAAQRADGIRPYESAAEAPSDVPLNANPPIDCHATEMAVNAGTGSQCGGSTVPAPAPAPAPPPAPASEDLCPKTGRAHEYALQRDVHYHPVCIECGEADLTRTVRDPADERRFARRERAG